MRNSLEGLEKRIVEELIKAGGLMHQSDLLETLGVPKSTLSVSLAKLESKGVIIRVRRGFRNLILLKTSNNQEH